MKVSVLLPTFNRPNWLKESVESVLSQEGVDFELVILDNGSGQETRDYLSTVQDPRVRRYRNEVNSREYGRSAWPDLLALATGEYFVLWTDDDVMEPGNLAAKAKALDESPGIGMVFSPVYEIDAAGGRVGIQSHGFVTEPVTFKSLFCHNQIPMPSAMVRKEYASAFEHCEEFGLWADWAFWLEIAFASAIGYVPTPLVKYRIHSGSDSESRGVNDGGFLALYPKIWGHWLDRGHVPSQEDWELMRKAYLFMANATFLGFQGRHRA